MIINKLDKWIFVEVPRTGSTSLFHHIRENCHVTHSAPSPYRTIFKDGEYCDKIGDLNLEPHSKLTHIESKIPLNEYRIYGVIRDPIERFVSGIYFYTYLKSNRNKRFIESININVIAKRVLYHLNNNTFNEKDLFDTQHSFFETSDNLYIDNVFPYERLSDLSMKLTNKEIPYNYWKTDLNKGKLDDKIKEDVLSLYSKDKELYDEIKKR